MGSPVVAHPLCRQSPVPERYQLPGFTSEGFWSGGHPWDYWVR